MEVFSSANVMFMLGGFVKTLEISALSIFFSLIFGTVLALVKAYAAKPFSLLVSAYIELFRCTPNLLWILFIYFTVKGNDVFISTLAFTIFTSAVMAEIVRGGLNSIPQSQFEAAQRQGFDHAPHHPASDVQDDRPRPVQPVHDGHQGQFLSCRH